MKRVILPVTAVAAFALSASVFADNTDATSSNAALTAQVNQLSSETKKLEKEVTLLKKKNKKSAMKKVAAKGEASVTHPVASATTPNSTVPWNHFVTVTTTPFLEQETAFDGSDLLFNMASMNQDLGLLQHRRAIVDQMHSQGYHLNRPVLQVSGGVEGQLFSNGGFGTKATDGVSLSTGEIDLNAIASSWANAFMSLDYNGAPISTGNRAPNATIYLARGFATIGNLNVAPVYFTGGQMYEPYGRYSSDMINTPVTQSMGRILSPGALLGVVFDNGFNASAYGFSGSQTSGASALFKQAGFNAGFKHDFDSSHNINLGGGWVSNVADAQGQQNNGAGTSTGQFGGFAVAQPGSSVSNNNLTHSVDGYDFNASTGLGPITLIGEFLGAAEKYAATDMTFNGVGAEPRSMHAEVDYLLPFFAKKHSTTLGFAYGRTWQALALNLPQDKYSAFLNTSIWRETTEGLEYDYAQDYASSAVATGRGFTAATPATGKHSNTVTAQFGVFF